MSPESVGKKGVIIELVDSICITPVAGILTDLSSGTQTTVTDEEVTVVWRVSIRRIIVAKKVESW